MKSKEDHDQDSVARFLAVVAILVSMSSAYYAWSVSPFYYAKPEELSYWTESRNSLSNDNKPLSSELKVFIKNNGDQPAKNVLVAVETITNAPEINCDQRCQQQKGVENSFLIEIKTIPPKQTATVHVKEAVTEYPWCYGWDSKYTYAGSVLEVQNEFGIVMQNRKKSSEHFSRLPDDK